MCRSKSKRTYITTNLKYFAIFATRGVEINKFEFKQLF